MPCTSISLGFSEEPHPPWLSAEIIILTLAPKPSHAFGIALTTGQRSCSLPPFRQLLTAPPNYTKPCLSGQSRVVSSPPFLKTCLARLPLSSKIYLPLHSYMFDCVKTGPVGGRDVRVCLLPCRGAQATDSKGGNQRDWSTQTMNTWSFWRLGRSNQWCSVK